MPINPALLPRIGFCSLLSCLAVLLPPAAASDALNRFDYWQGAQSPLSPEGIAKLENFLKTNGSSSFLILYKGKIAYQYGDIHQKHLIHSMRKPLMNMLYGISLKSTDISLEETVSTLNIQEDNIVFSENEQSATLEQLLQARSGIYLPAAAETDLMAQYRPERDSHNPGEAYYYNNWSFNSVGTVYEQKTGHRIFDDFADYLAKPLRMTSYKNNITTLTITEETEDLDIEGVDGFYSFEPEKSRHPAYHFRLSTHDLALIGQLLVKGGRWNGKQIIPSDWIEKSTACYSVLNADIGGGRSLCYGMMWEVVQQDGKTTAFTHTGLGVHMLYIYPGAEFVMIHRVDTEKDYDFPAGKMPQLIGLSFNAFR